MEWQADRHPGKQRFFGVVKKADPSGQYCFIDCQDAFKLHGVDVFVPRETLRHCLPEDLLKVGDHVSFEIIAINNQPRAQNLQAARSIRADPAERRYSGADPAQCRYSGADPAECRYSGTIKSFNELTGFGFIECPETFLMFGRDVFLHKQQRGRFAQGDSVTFKLELSKGKPQAQDLQGCSTGPTAADSNSAVRMSRSAAAAGAAATCAAFVTSQAPLPPSHSPLRVGPEVATSAAPACAGGEQAPQDVGAYMASTFTGRVKSFQQDKGWGFIVPDSSQPGLPPAARDVFVHSKNLIGCFGLVASQRVCFQLFFDKGRPQARNVRPERIALSHKQKHDTECSTAPSENGSST